MPTFKRRPRGTLEYGWDPDKRVTVRNLTDHNILLDLPTGHFRLDARRSFRMTPDIAQIPQVQELVAAGKLEVTGER